MSKKKMFEKIARDIVADSLKRTYNISKMSDKQVEFANEISDRLYTVFEGSLRVKDMEQFFDLIG